MTNKLKKEKMKSNLSVYKFYNKIKDKSFILYYKDAIDLNNPLGYAFSISPKDKMIYINGRYRYHTEKQFNKIMKELKRLVEFYDKQTSENIGKENKNNENNKRINK